MNSGEQSAPLPQPVVRRQQRLSVKAGRLLRSSLKVLIHFVFAAALITTGMIEVEKISQQLSLSKGILSFLLVSGPLASYLVYWDVRAAGRPALASLTFALAVFFALMSLAISNLGDPIAMALGRPADGSDGVAEALRYSLYDMLSLIGLVATISLIVLAALVPEEARMIERRREARRRVLDAFQVLCKALQAFVEAARREKETAEMAGASMDAAADVEAAIDKTELLDFFREQKDALLSECGVTARAARTRITPAKLPSTALLSERLAALRMLLERGLSA